MAIDHNSPALAESYVLCDKKYIVTPKSFIKRTLRRHEWQTAWNSRLIIPSQCWPQRWRTDAANLAFIAANTTIPVPRVNFAFEDDGAFYFSTRMVDGVSMRSLPDDKKAVVQADLDGYIAQLRALKRDRPGVPGSDLLCPPIRVYEEPEVTGNGGWNAHCCFRLKPGWRPTPGEEYVFCHNDLGRHNILVNPETLKVMAVIDWEYGGFWPAWFEGHFWKRDGPSGAVGDEECDVKRLRAWLEENCDPVPMPPL
ncbi:hypothetical protein VHEMI02751 [[Torrubiella] hemipterigena]|uniref:Uncharacterized protein n=1 Tax=[Torrubiella] hemipterigena TaxID=1531966 RepID=A0A0A1T8V6_9HYPO|nr:hypothetical protein VHEMI02751 [[Torrubiella] hemipterigena]